MYHICSIYSISHTYIFMICTCMHIYVRISIYTYKGTCIYTCIYMCIIYISIHTLPACIHLIYSIRFLLSHVNSSSFYLSLSLFLCRSHSRCRSSSYVCSHSRSCSRSRSRFRFHYLSRAFAHFLFSFSLSDCRRSDHLTSKLR